MRVRDSTESFFTSVLKKDSPESFILLFSPIKLVRLFILMKVKLSPDSKVVKLLSFDNLFPPLPSAFSLKLVVK